MVDKRLGIAVLLAISLGAGVLAERLGLLHPGRRVWRTCLFWAAFGVVLVMSVDLMQRGFSNILSLASLFAMAIGAVGGALAALLMSYLERRWPS